MQNFILLIIILLIAAVVIRSIMYARDRVNNPVRQEIYRRLVFINKSDYRIYYTKDPSEKGELVRGTSGTVFGNLDSFFS
jgi:hypothetical protein